jgi:hypothetical protein
MYSMQLLVSPAEALRRCWADADAFFSRCTTRKHACRQKPCGTQKVLEHRRFWNKVTQWPKCSLWGLDRRSLPSCCIIAMQ